MPIGIGDYSTTHTTDNRTWNFGNIANDLNFNNLFGGGNSFNLGAGSSSFLMDSTTTDLSSLFEHAGNIDASKTSGASQEATGSLGFGFGAEGRGGDVWKDDHSSDSTDLSGILGKKSNSSIWLIAGAGGIALILIVFLFKKKRKRA